MPFRSKAWCCRSWRESTFMYWLNPSSMKPYQVSFTPTIMGHHWWPVSWSEAPRPASMYIGYSMPPSGPCTTVICDQAYGIHRCE